MKRILGLSLLAASLAACDDSPTEPKARLPDVGEQIQLNVQFGDNCGNAVMRAGRVAAVSSRAIMVQDATNPAPGFTDADYQEFAAAYDNLVWPVVTRTFGEPEDIDNNDRVVFFVTRAINELTSPSSGTYINGLFFSRDLFPTRDKGNLSACAASNVGEIVYLLAPDAGRGGPFSYASARAATVGVMAHETQHVISASRRLYTLKVGGTEWNEAVWLNEGLSHIAEELVFYQASGLTPRRNVDRPTIQSSAQIANAYNAFMVSNAARYLNHLTDPERDSPYQTDDDVATRGAIWNFLRYAADRRGGDEQPLWNTLLNSRTTGMTNLRAALGTDPIPFFRDWAVSVYLDDAVPGVDARFAQPSWNFRGLFASGLPLRTRRLNNATMTSVSLTPGGAAYLRFGVGAARAEVRVTSGGQGPAGACAVVPALAVGQVHTVAPGAGQSLCVEQAGDYTLVAFYGAETEGDALGVDVLATGIQAVAATPSPSLTPEGREPFSLGGLPVYHEDVDVRRRLQALQREMAGHVAGASFSTASAAPDPTKLYLSVARTR
ncbi:MAG TPA: hypothetical protein VF615_19315 [Longimicrobiaceae bacterium]|jgi:hypothetical protein